MGVALARSGSGTSTGSKDPLALLTELPLERRDVYLHELAAGRVHERRHLQPNARILSLGQVVLRVEGPLGEVRHGIEQLKDAGAAAKALPGGLRDTVKEWKTGLKGLGEDHPAGAPVEGVSFDAWVEVKAGLSRDAVPEANEGPYAETHGVPAGRWDAVNSTWEQRVEWNQLARALYEKAMAEGA